MADNKDDTIVDDVTKTNTEEDTTAIEKTQEQRDSEMVAKLVAERIEKELAPIKSKLDKAYQQRDETLAKLAEFERKEKEARMKLLEDEGKHKEVYELRLAEEKAANEALRRQNTELSRDVSVRDAISGLPFRSAKSQDMAFKEITNNLVQNEQGMWVHRSGISIREYCNAFSKDEENSFLFKPKTNSGSGAPASNSGNSKPGAEKPTSLFKMPQAEVLKLAAEGKLKGQTPQI